MSDSNQGHHSYGSPGGENPYGGPPPQHNPYGSGPPAESTDGQGTGGPAAPPQQSPYAAPPPPSPAAAPPPQQSPYGAPPAQPNPYGAPPAQQNPYGSAGAYYPPAGPLGDGLDMYGRPLGRKVSDERPGTVTAAGWITLVVSGLSFLLYGFFTLAMVVAKNDVTKQIDKAISDSGQSTTTFSAEDAYGLVLGILVIVTLWSLIACLLGVMVMRRSRIARILLVISSIVAGLFCLIGIGSIVSAVPLLACLAVVVLLFTGGANEWYRDRA